MKDETQKRLNAATRIRNGEVERLAMDAIRKLTSETSGQTTVLKRRLEMLCDAFLSSEEHLHHDAILKMRQERIPGRDIIDTVIPAVARLMGDRWFADDISFAHVTIGAARLQETVRLLTTRALNGNRRPIANMDHAPVLMIIPRSEQHTLGTFIAADQIRRYGHTVDIAMDQTPRQIAGRLKKQRYAMVGISASGRRTLASATELVDTIQTTVTRVTPIAIGGAIVERGDDVLGITGADYIARDTQATLRACGLSTVVSGQAPPEQDGEAVDREPAVVRVTT
ncbi:MAG: cobalamin B12-binding domain-containing protein [Pseudomonadota bacterium]